MKDYNQYTNIAFISYKREDEKWARWLQKKLEYYKLPTNIKANRNEDFANSPRLVFRDSTDFCGGSLEDEIKHGLNSSKFLIIICSPRAVHSEWVCKEVQYFIDSGREDFIIPFIVDGEPYSNNPENECYPKALRTQIKDKYILGINVNENGKEAASVKVIATMFNIRFDVLWQRFRREKK